MSIQVLKNLLNSPSAEEAPRSCIEGVSPCSVVALQFTALNAVYGAYMASTNEFWLIGFIGLEIILLTDSDRKAPLHKAEQKAQKKRELQREIDQETEDFDILLKELAFQRTHREILLTSHMSQNRFSLQSA